MRSAAGPILCLTIGFTTCVCHPAQCAEQAAPATATEQRLAPTVAAPWSLALGHRADIVKIAFAPKENVFASASREGTIVLRDSATGNAVRTFAGGGAPVNCLAFSHDGAFIAAGTGKNEIIVWNVGTGVVKETLKVQTVTDLEEKNGVLSLAFSLDGNRLAMGSNGSIRVWDWQTRKLLRRIVVDGVAISRLAFAPDNVTLLGGDGTGPVRSWDTKSGTAKDNYGYGDKRLGASFILSPDGRWAAFLSPRRITLWNVEKNAQAASIAPPGDTASIAFSSDGKHLIGAVHPNLLVIWNTEKGEIVQAAETGAGLPTTEVAAMALSPDGKWIAAGSVQGLVRTWNAVTAAQVANVPGFILKVTSLLAGAIPISSGPAGSVIGAYSDGTVRVWDAATGKPQKTLSYADHIVVAMALSPGGKTLALCYGWNSYTDVMDTQGVAYQEVQLLDTATWNPKRTIKISNFRSPVTSLRFSADGALLAAGTTFPSPEDAVRVWGAESGALKYSLGQQASLQPRFAAFSSDGKWVGASSESGSGLQIWDMATQTPRLKNLNGSPSPAKALLFLPDNKKIVVASEYGLHLFDIESGKWLLGVEKVSEAANRLALSEDGTLLANSVASGGVKLWALPDWRFKGYLPQANNVVDIAITADSRKVVTADSNGAIKLWNGANLELLATMQILPGDGKTADGQPANRKEPSHDWIAFTPRGYYAASKNAPTWLNWQDNAPKGNLQDSAVLQATLQAK